jgi:hypothetical protein
MSAATTVPRMTMPSVSPIRYARSAGAGRLTGSIRLNTLTAFCALAATFDQEKSSVVSE